MNSQYNWARVELKSPGEIADHITQQLKLIARALRGPVVFDAGSSGVAKTVTPDIADITEVQLTANTTITLNVTDKRKAAAGRIEFTQDATGGRTVAFVNLVGAVPAVSATANKRTLIEFTHVGDGWVGHVVATGY